MAYLLAIIAIISCFSGYFFLNKTRKARAERYALTDEYWEITQNYQKIGSDAFDELMAKTKQTTDPLDRFIWDAADMFLGYRPVSRTAAKYGGLYGVRGNAIFIDEPTTQPIAVFYETLENAYKAKNGVAEDTPIIALINELKNKDTYKYGLLKTAIMSMTISVWYLNLLDSENAFDTKIPKRIKFNLIAATSPGVERQLKYIDVLNAMSTVFSLKDNAPLTNDDTSA